MTELHLIPERQLVVEAEKNRIKKVSIQRIDLKKWFAIFEVGDRGEPSAMCAIRVQQRPSIRYWADLRLLVEWIRDHCGVEQCSLLLRDVDPADFEPQ